MTSNFDRRGAALEHGASEGSPVIVITIRGGLPGANANENTAIILPAGGVIEYQREPHEPVSEFQARVCGLAALERAPVVFGGLPR